MKLLKITSCIAAFMTAIALTACSSSTDASITETISEDTSEALIEATESISEKTLSSTSAAITLIGHSSVKIKTTDGKVIYIDPAYNKTEGGYDEAADLILVTHGHSDHNQISLVTQNDDCQVITYKEALPNPNEYQSFDVDGIKIEAIAAENSNHSINSCVGYLLTFDGITVYHAGDTSPIQSVADTLSQRTIDYAFYPIDGRYNMDAETAAKYADEIGAANNIPIHIKELNDAYDSEKASTFAPNGAMYIAYGDSIILN